MNDDKKKKFIFSSIIFSSIILLSACQSPTTYRPEVTAEELRAEEEIQRQMVEEAAQRGGAPRPWRNRQGMQKQFTQVAERVEEAGAALCQEMGLPAQGERCYYYFDTTRDLDINAYADGKYIVVTLGMLRFLENEDELAAIMAHELAHNLMGHVDATKNNALAGGFLGLVLDAAAASQGVSTGGDFTRIGAGAGVLSYSVSFEQEADYIGLYIATRAGYDIRRAPTLWRRWSVEEPRGIYNSRTHPSHAERFVAMQKTINEIEYKRKHHVALVPDFKQEVTNY